MKKKILVLAGDRLEYQVYLDVFGIDKTEAVFGYDPTRIRAANVSRVEVFGTFWERRDAKRLFDLAQSRLK